MRSISPLNDPTASLQFSFGESVPLESLSDFERDISFYQKRKKGKCRFVEPPTLYGPVADTHAHLDMLEHPGRAIARSAYYGVSFICTIMDVHEDAHTTFAQLPHWFEDARELYDRFELGDFAADAPCVRIGIGCHPHNAKFYDEALEERLLSALKDPLVAAIGEIGLDYHYDHSPRSAQREAFRRQIALAHQTGLPVILHLREAHDEGLAIMEEEGFPEAGVLLHCFNLDETILKPWVEHGCYIAYGGPLTFKNTPEVRRSALRVPLDRLLTETDSPYMTPEPLRGIECGPEFTIFTAAKMLEIFNRTTEEEQHAMLEQLFDNARSLLDRKPTPWQRG